MEAEGNESAAGSVQGDDSDLHGDETSFGANGRPRRSAAANYGSGRGRSSRSRGFSADEMDEDEDPSEPELGDDEEDGDAQPESDEDDEDLNEDEMMIDDEDLDDRPRNQLIVELKVKNKDRTSAAGLTPSPEDKGTRVETEATDPKSPSKTSEEKTNGPRNHTPEPDTKTAADLPPPGPQATSLAFRGSPEKTQTATSEGNGILKE